MLDLWSRRAAFDSRSGLYQVVTTLMGHCLWNGKPSRYITNHQGQLSLPSLGVGKSSTGVSDWVKVGCIHMCWVTLCDPIWLVTLRSCEMGYRYELSTAFNLFHRSYLQVYWREVAVCFEADLTRWSFRLSRRPMLLLTMSTLTVSHCQQPGVRLLTLTMSHCQQQGVRPLTTRSDRHDAVQVDSSPVDCYTIASLLLSTTVRTVLSVPSL